MWAEVKERRFNEIKGIILLAAGLIILAGLVSFTPFDISFYTTHPNVPPKNFIRTFGAYFSGVLFFFFGVSSYLIPLFVLAGGVLFFKQRRPDLRLPRLMGMLLLMLSVSSIAGIFISANRHAAFSASGYFGFLLSGFVSSYFGKLGGYILFITLGLLSFALVTEVLISTLVMKTVERAGEAVGSLRAGRPAAERRPYAGQRRSRGSRPEINDGEAEEVDPRTKSRQEPKENIIEKIKKGFVPAVKPEKKAQVIIKAQPAQSRQEPPPAPKPVKVGDYQLPTYELLDSPPPVEARQIREDLAGNARILEETMSDFGISVKVTNVERGPVITRYELEPAPGVKLNKIVVLGDDIALAMKAQSVRIVAPIPGKGRVGVEVPNMQSSLVYLKDILSSRDFTETKYKLPLALGKDITGQPVVADLSDMPHLLIAGTTGSGKTVCVNCLILSLLLKFSPEQLKLLMVDPKMVELAPFNGMPHLLCPVVTEAKKAAVALNWLVGEMEERYRMLAKAGARNITAYNAQQVGQEKMPYIVIIVDELADLMSVSRDQIESAIARLAQLSRAVGIHLILATQRPSVDVITGVIKANFPSRVSFKVPSKVDSRTVLDMNGADKLLGKGDMLFLRPGEAKLIRAQGALVSDKEIDHIVDFIKKQAEPVYREEVLKEHGKTFTGGGDKDEMYAEAVRVVMETNQASVSILQRRLRLGYSRAARIIDMMEQDGLVGPFEGSKPRKIVIDREEWLQKDMMAREGREEESVSSS